MEESTQHYKTRCSLETLRSQSKGFFRDFTELVCKSVGNSWILTNFGEKIKSDKDRIEILFTDPIVKKPVLEILSRVKHIYRDKDASISRSKRLRAEKYNSTGDYEMALLYFSQAVLRATVTGKDQSIDNGYSYILAIFGRAKVLMTLGEYGFARNDLNLAAEETLPSSLRTEFQNLEECCFELIRKSKNTRPYRSTLKRNIYVKPATPHLTSGPCESMPGFSKLLEIKETENAGVHAIAAEKINVGDILAIEPPFVSCLLPEYYGTHCQNCFIRLRAPVGCPNCSLVAFCSKSCQDLGMETYHKYECKILALLIGSGMSILSILALRIVTERGLDYCKQMYERLNFTDNLLHDDKNKKTEINLSHSKKRLIRKKKLSASLITEKCDASNFENQISKYDKRPYDLVTHDSSRSAIDFFERTLMAAFLLKCLQTAKFFGEPSSDTDKLCNESLAVAVVLLRNLQLLQFNAHEISETRISEEYRLQKSKVVYIGVALYINCARFNHDCYPAVTRYFTGRDIVIRATRPLNPGEAAAENYGPIFTKRSLKDRQRLLEGRYWFKCSCLACIKDWPNFDNLIHHKTQLKCTTKDCPGLLEATKNRKHLVKCSICKKKINIKNRINRLDQCVAKYSKGFDLMDKGKPVDALEELTMALEQFHKIACPPHRETHLAEIALAACMAESGNIWKL